MKMIFDNLKVEDLTGSLNVDFADAGCRFIIKILRENPDLIECLYQNLLHFEKFGGLGGNSDVKVDHRTDALLKKVMGRD